MASSTRLIRLTWENNVNFKMDSKLNDGNYITIVSLEENACISLLWPDVQSICEKFFNHVMTDIGTEMKS